MYKFIEYLKDWTIRPFLKAQKPNSNEQNDAKKLATMCSSIGYVWVMKYQEKYFYCEINDNKNLHMARRLLRKNGVKAKLYGPTEDNDKMGFRVRASKVRHNFFVDLLHIYSDQNSY